MKKIAIPIGLTGIYKLPCYIGIEIVEKARIPHFCYCKEGIMCQASANSSTLNWEHFKKPTIKKGSFYYKCFLLIPQRVWEEREEERDNEMIMCSRATPNFVLSKKNSYNACSKECLKIIIKEHIAIYKEIYSKNPHENLMQKFREVLPEEQKQRHEKLEKNKAVIFNLNEYTILENETQLPKI